jgi:hypothetical protein
MLSFVNVIASLLYCIYLMHELHHILLEYCNYLMMQSWLWQMVRMRASDDDVLDIPVDIPLVEMHRHHHRVHRSA